VVGIAGPSGSGKTTLAHAVADRSRGVVFALDAYYHDQRTVSEAEIDVDIPGAIDVDLAISHLQALIAGHPIDQPVYDYATHSRTDAVHSLPSAPVVIVEGLFAFYWAKLRELMHARVFVTLQHDECMRRRIERDMRERGRTRAEVVATYQRKVRPMYDRYVDPTRHHAHMVLDGTLPIDRLTDGVLGVIDSRAPGELPGERQR
jgi:uridine kinase